LKLGVISDTLKVLTGAQALMTLCRDSKVQPSEVQGFAAGFMLLASGQPGKSDFRPELMPKADFNEFSWVTVSKPAASSQ